MVSAGDSVVKVSVDAHDGPSQAIDRSLKVQISRASETSPAGVQNDGYWGMAVRPNWTYAGSFYAKTDAPVKPETVGFGKPFRITVAGPHDRDHGGHDHADEAE